MNSPATPENEYEPEIFYENNSVSGVVIQTPKMETANPAASQKPAGPSYEGRVDYFDLNMSVNGWALNLGDTEAPVTLELWADDLLLGNCETGLARPDVLNAFKCEGFPGYAFEGDILARARSYQEINPGVVFSIRPAQSTFLLKFTNSTPTAGSESIDDDEPESGADLTLLGRLSALESEAHGLYGIPVRADSCVGFIEAMARDENNLVWVIGWMQRDGMVDRPVIIQDDTKYAGGFVYTLFNRPDLPAEAAGFVGVLQTDWQPSAETTPIFFIQIGTGRHLRAVSPVNIVPKSTLVSYARPHWQTAESKYTLGLKQLVAQSQSWDILPEDYSAERMAVEEIQVIPKFGCFVTGWAISPTKTLDTLHLRAGQTVMSCDPSVITFKPRPDLATLLPNADDVLQRAGFSAFFEGDIDDADIGDLRLKIAYTDRTALNFQISPKQVRKINHSGAAARLQNIYPTIMAEPFFPRMAKALRRLDKLRARNITVLHAAPTSHALVFAAPRSQSDIYLMFAGIREHVNRLDKDTGVVILASSDEFRANIVFHFNELKAFTNHPVSLVFIEDVRLAAYAVPAVLEKHIQARTFVFVASSSYLSPAGWAAASQARDGLTFLDIRNPVQLSAPGQASFGCFAWNVPGLKAYLDRTDTPAGGLDSLPPAEKLMTLAKRVPDAANALFVASPSPLLHAINSRFES
ncbi:hypothetical protein ABAC460_13980 [Asticcacaulis sp. AC460]|uniref:hypothetical protein n=1 Tax=Asticcacaulis sp. AC460 TaxID=1282360 RepID=UPI0003C401CA|nr:hypothetical protein [Asticcacaulis sp. AC460]ESQ88885.1 hypothetical protein ABAC460_13980 [Asticcacaulis sp. AC460]